VRGRGRALISVFDGNVRGWLWMLLIGYGSNAIPGPNFNIWISSGLPLIGGPLGAFIYDYIVHQHLPVPVGPDVPEPAVERARARV